MKKLKNVLIASIVLVSVAFSLFAISFKIKNHLNTISLFNHSSEIVSSTFNDYVIKNSYSDSMNEMLEYINQPFSKVVDYYGDNYVLESSEDVNAMNFCLYTDRIVYPNNKFIYKINVYKDQIEDEDIYHKGIINNVTLDTEGIEIVKGIHIGDSLEDIFKETKNNFTDINNDTFSYSVYFDNNVNFSFEFYKGILKDCYLTKYDNIAYNIDDDISIKTSYDELVKICNYFNDCGDLRYDINNFYYSGVYYSDRTESICYEWANDNFEYDGDKVYILIEAENERRGYVIFASEDYYSGLNLIWKNGQYASPIEDYLGLWSNKQYKDYYYLYIKEVNGYDFVADYYYYDGKGYSKVENIVGSFGYSVDFATLKNSSYMYFNNSIYPPFIILINEKTYTIDIQNVTTLDIKNNLDENITKDTISRLENNLNSIESFNENITEPNDNPQDDYEEKDIVDKQTISDSTGKWIGHIYILKNGDKIVRSANGKYLGKYQKDIDRTLDASGKIVYFGDNAASLLTINSFQ